MKRMTIVYGVIGLALLVAWRLIGKQVEQTHAPKSWRRNGAI